MHLIIFTTTSASPSTTLNRQIFATQVYAGTKTGKLDDTTQTKGRLHFATNKFLYVLAKKIKIKRRGKIAQMMPFLASNPMNSANWIQSQQEAYNVQGFLARISQLKINYTTHKLDSTS